MANETPEVILKIGVDSTGVYSEIDKVKAKYGEVGAAIRENKLQLQALLSEEKELLKARAKTNNPTIQAQLTNEIKKTQGQINKVTDEIKKQSVALKDLDKEANKTSVDLKKAFDGTAATSLRSELRKLKTDLALATDPDEALRLSRAVGELQDKIGDATDSARIFSTDSKFESLNLALGDIGSKILSFDFEGAAKSAKTLLVITQSITFADTLKGIKDVSTTLINVGKSILTNPLFILAGIIGGISFAVNGMIDSFKEGDKPLADSAERLKDIKEATEDLIKANRDLALENQLAQGSISKFTAEQIKNQNQFKDEFIKVLRARRAEEAKINEDFQKAREEDEFRQTKNLLDALGFETDAKKKHSQALLESERTFNEQIDALRKRFALNAQRSVIDENNEAARKRLSDAQKAEQERLAALKKLRDLEASNITDEFARRRAQLVIKYNDEFTLAKGNADIILELRRQLDREIASVDEEEVRRNKAKLDKIISDADIANAEALQEFLADQRSKLDLAQEELTEEQRHQTELLKIRVEGQKNSNAILLANELSNAQAQLIILENSGVATEQEITKQNNKIIELKAKLNDELKGLNKEQLIDALENIERLEKAAVDSANRILNVYIKSLDAQTKAQQKRVDEATKIAENGNSQLLELEKKRLSDLNDEREQFVRIQQGLAAAQLVAETAVMVAKAGSEGGAAAAITIGAALLALVAGLAEARAISSQAAFYKGGEGYTGDGNPTQESTAVGRKAYKYHKREYIFNHQTTDKYIQHFRDIHNGKMDLNKVVKEASLYRVMSANNIDPTRQILVKNNNSGNDKIDELKPFLRETAEAIKNQDRLKIHIDKDGIAIIATSYMGKRNRLNNLSK